MAKSSSNHILTTTSGASGDIFISTGGGGGGGSGVTTTTATTVEQLSEKEKKKLDSLLADRNNWIKQKKLESFQKLPAHLRQQVVDESCIKECINQMNNIDTSKFEGQFEIEKLEKKQYDPNQLVFNNVNISTGGTAWIGYDNYYKHTDITDQLTKDELMNAHAAITLEENLGED